MNERIRKVELKPTENFPFKSEMVEIYKAAFAGYPWFEELSEEEVNRRLETQASKPGFEAVFLINDKQEIIAASWFDTPTLDELEEERGQEIRSFAENLMSDNKIEKLIWQRETLVSPQYQGRNFGTKIKEVVFDKLEKVASVSNERILVLTRMRDDNKGIIHINKKFGMHRTGIKVPSSQVEGVFHEFWYQIVDPR